MPFQRIDSASLCSIGIYRLLFCLPLLCIVFCAGCGGPSPKATGLAASPPTTAPTSKPTLISISNALLTYQGEGRGQPVDTVAWSPDGTRLVSGGGDSTVQVWNAASGQILVRYNGHAQAGIYFAAWSPTSKMIATTDPQGPVQVWDAMTGRQIITYAAHTKAAWGVAWSPDGTRIASGSDDGTVQIWNALTGHTITVYQGSSSGIRQVAWSPDGSRVALACQDNTVQIFDAATGKTLFVYRGHTQPVWGVAWSPDSTRIVSTSGSSDTETGTIQEWNATTGQTLASATVTSRGRDAAGLLSVTWSPDGQQIAVGGADGTVFVWNAVAGTNRTPIWYTHVVYLGQNETVWDVTWSPDSKQIASASQDGTVKIWRPV